MQHKEDKNKVTPKIKRLLYMYILLKNYGGIEYNDLITQDEEELKFSRRTFEKDIRCMRKAGLMVVYNTEYKNYSLRETQLMEMTEQNPFIIKVNRLYQIINHIQTTNTFTKEWYQDTFHLSTRTMNRDIKELGHINIYIRYCFWEGQYEICDNSFW